MLPEFRDFIVVVSTLKRPDLKDCFEGKVPFPENIKDGITQMERLIEAECRESLLYTDYKLPDDESYYLSHNCGNMGDPRVWEYMAKETPTKRGLINWIKKDLAESLLKDMDVKQMLEAMEKLGIE